MQVLHITPKSNGYEVVTLVANAINKKNSLSAIMKNGEMLWTGGIILNDTPNIRHILDHIHVDKQYDFVREFKEVPFVKSYLEE